ncbi:MAG TPA: efflux transporter outer membrane subunit [Burkholderiales bacterium]|nr:efflux transporter outer membrane subunit [Burkholderiales bacterium]
MLHKTALALAVCALALGGCALPLFQKPATEVPAAWKDLAPAGQAATGDRWWTIYNDPALDRLVDEGLANNRDLAIAAARIEEAQALFRITDAERIPAVGANVQRDRSRSSGRSSMPLPPGTPLLRDNYRATIDVSYEVDLWGRLRGASNAARADLLATQAARETIRIALVNEIVLSYYNLRALDMQVAVTQRTIEIRARDLGLQRIRYDAGLIADFNLRQLEAEVAQARSQLPVLQQRRTSEEVALVTVLGRSGRAIIDESITLAPDSGALAPATVPEGLPSDLLLRRPDIIDAEQRLAAANARVGVARASLFPRIALTGFLGSESGSLGELFSAPARIWQLAFGLAQPIFQGGRLRAEIDVATARERQALAQYQKTVQTAFGEVREALSSQTRAREAFESETARVAALSETLRLARIRFENGLSSQLEVLDAERNLLNAELNRIDALRLQRTAVADLVRALGGGWGGELGGAAGQGVTPTERVTKKSDEKK